MASAELSRRAGKVVGYPPLSDMGADRRREFLEALLDADSFEDLPGRWQAAIVRAEQTRRPPLTPHVVLQVVCRERLPEEQPDQRDPCAEDTEAEDLPPHSRRGQGA